MEVTLQEIEAAAERIRGHVVETPCPVSIPLSEATGMQIYCKLEHLQRTGSFKERGARNDWAITYCIISNFLLRINLKIITYT